MFSEVPEFFCSTLALCQRTPHMGRFFYPGPQAAENGRKPPGPGTISFDLKVLFLCHIHIQKHTKTIQIITKTYKSNAKTMQKHEKSKFSRAREARAGFLTFYL